MKYHITLKSRNHKTGGMPVTTSPKATCPTCEYHGNGCYAESWPLALHWRAVSAGERGGTWAQLLEAISALPAGSPWRHNQAGDLPGAGDVVDAKALAALADANAGRRGFTYTHKPMASQANRRAVKAANARVFTINLSANSLPDADRQLAAKAGPVVVVVKRGSPRTQFTPGGAKVVACPQQYRPGLTCASGMLCQRADRSVVVSFEAHGASAARAERACA